MEEFYLSLDIHRRMLRDDVRNEAYRQALFAAVKPGDAVLDVGAGTGVLSLFAAQAGARRVYAVERTHMAYLTQRVIASNGFEDRIQVIQADAAEVALPEKVDVIVSEWLGTIGVDENMLAAVLSARDRWLKPGGLMLPKTVRALMVPLWSKELHDGMTFWQGRPYGLDLSLIGKATADELTWPTDSISEDDFLAPPQVMWETDSDTYPAEQARLPFRSSLTFTATRAAQVNALAAWFHAEFINGITLTNAPAKTPTHWKQYVIPLHRSIEVTPGTEIDAEFTCIPAGAGGFCFNAWSVRVGSGPWEHHDTRRNTLFE